MKFKDENPHMTITSDKQNVSLESVPINMPLGNIVNIVSYRYIYEHNFQIFSYYLGKKDDSYFILKISENIQRTFYLVTWALYRTRLISGSQDM